MNKIIRFLRPNHIHLKAWSRQMCKIPALNAVSLWKRKLEEENIDDSDFAIKCIISHVLDVDFASINNYNNLFLNDEQQEKFNKLCECRISHMPIQYVIGNWDFRNVRLRMIPPVFIPRPETEQLVEFIAKDLKPSESYQILEVGCGSGAITCSILQELPEASIVALDCSRLACNLTKFNAREAGVDQRLNVIYHKVTEEQILPEEIEKQKFDVIVSNPPYVKSSDILKLAPEIKLYEDLRALDGGPDGLKIVRILCRIAETNLNKDGKMWLEVDSSQTHTIRDIIDKKFARNLAFLKSYKDLFGRERFVEVARQ